MGSRRFLWPGERSGRRIATLIVIFGLRFAVRLGLAFWSASNRFGAAVIGGPAAILQPVLPGDPALTANAAASCALLWVPGGGGIPKAAKRARALDFLTGEVTVVSDDDTRLGVAAVGRLRMALTAAVGARHTIDGMIYAVRTICGRRAGLRRSGIDWPVTTRWHSECST